MTKKTDKVANKKHKFSKDVARDICNWLEQDRSLMDLHKSNPEKYPNPSTVWRWMKSNAEFNQMMQESRMIQAFSYNEQLTELQANPPKQTGDKVMDHYNMRVWENQMRVVQFKLLKLAKIFDAKVFSEKSSVEVEHKGGPQVVIMDYSTMASLPKAEDDPSLGIH